MKCWACHHPEAEHSSLGCHHENGSEQVVTNDDGTIVQHLDMTVCDCPYFRRSLL